MLHHILSVVKIPG